VRPKTSFERQWPQAYLGEIDDALGHQVAALAVLGVEAVIVLLLVKDLSDDD
jgi:hypothetical protein